MNLPAWSLSRKAAIGAASILLVFWFAVLGVLRTERLQALETQATHNANLARALEEQTVRVIATIDQATIRMRDAVRTGDDALSDIAQFANETGLAPSILVQLSLIAPDGRFIGSNLDPDGRKTGPVDLSEREHVRVHLAPQAVPELRQQVHANGLFIGKPVLGKVSGRWTVQLSRRIDGPGGELRGVVVASLDPSYFENLYRSVTLGRQGGVTMTGADLVIRARVVGDTSVGMGSRIGPTSRMARADVGRSGDYIGVSTVDGVERIVGYRRIDDYPLYVLVSSSTEESLAEWRAMRNTTLFLAVLFSVAVMAATVLFLSSVRRLEATNLALAASEARAQSANQAKTEFLAAISHELRTPLTSIRGFAELMEKRLEQQKFRDQAGMIRRSAENLNTLLTEILDFAKVEAGAMRVEAVDVEIRPLVQGVFDFFAVSAADKGLELRLQVADGTPDSVVGDELRLKQILNNLLSNAIKFTSQGQVRIEVTHAERQLQLHVVDTGPGIAPDLHDVIFERFRQGNDRVSTEHGGTGLGLALSRGLAELMGGRLTVASEIGRGARFTLWMPDRTL